MRCLIAAGVTVVHDVQSDYLAAALIDNVCRRDTHRYR
jgi:hypothetical protein